ncbi:N-terminal acetyltransferase [Onygenales sp. PD_12]|nr:N-terminal acetyltransferase [Onygenales sp. PD_12]KAK2799053.1 N-terminal acetyltransferase [Onygenales sp. PD_10]
MGSIAPQPPTYTRDQLAKYINFLYNSPPETGLSKLSEIEASIQRDALGALTTLVQRHLAVVPWTNIVLHYSQHHTVSLDPDVLFHKLVERGLGGYCMENTGLLAIVIRSLGYQVYATGARVSRSYHSANPTREYMGWGHMVLIVNINGTKYMVDVGFGPSGPTRPLPLQENKVVTAVAPAEMRVTKDNISGNVDRTQRLWIYQTRSNPEDPWKDGYCFYDIEFGAADFAVMNFTTSQSTSSMFTKKFVCAKFLLNEAEDDITGTLWIAGAEVKRSINGNTEALVTLGSEAERVSALEKWFNVHLHPMEVRGITGSPAEILPARWD